MNFTLICATIDSTEIVSEFIRHIDQSKKNNSYLKVHLIIIDQFKKSRSNEFINLTENLTYIHSKKRGLSYNRNIGLSNLDSEIFSFIDCDCRIDSYYFEKIYEFFSNNESGILYGKIQELDKTNDLFKKWPKKEKNLNYIERWLFSTSVNIVYRKTDLLLDEDLGLGSTYGSCEDIDFAIRQFSKAHFNPKLIVMHPFQNFSTNSNIKIYNYALGFGALCKKHLSLLSLILLVISIFSTIIKLIKRKSNFEQAKYSIKGKINGFFNYKKK